jgi:uncharacterized protein YPO0396
MNNEITVEILKDIRAEIRATNSGQVTLREELSKRIDETNRELGAVREELSKRIVASEMRTATALTELAGSVQDVAAMLRLQHDLRPRVERCES